MLLVVAGLLRNARGQVLLSQRPPGDPLGLTWEFPGGKVEQGETPEQALQRELREELAIEVTHMVPWRFVSHAYGGFHLLMPVFHCQHWQGDPQPREVHDLRWFDHDELPTLPMPPADLPLVAELMAEKLLRRGSRG